MRRYPLDFGTPALTNLWRNKYAGMADFLGDPVRTETVFTLEEKLRRVEEEEEDEKAFGREPGPEVVAVSCASERGELELESEPK